MQLLEDISKIVREIEAQYGLQLTDDQYTYSREKILRVFLHESCHAVVAGATPWIFDLPEYEHTVIDEILARLLETDIARALGLPVHTAQEQVDELELYEEEPISLEQFEELANTWQTRYRRLADLNGMARYIQSSVFPAEA